MANKRVVTVLTNDDVKVLRKMYDGHCLKSLKDDDDYSNIFWLDDDTALDKTVFLSLRKRNLISEELGTLSKTNPLRYHKITKKAKEALKRELRK